MANRSSGSSNASAVQVARVPRAGVALAEEEPKQLVVLIVFVFHYYY